jgi:CubicO group peptidase (beta-lactamase class C family)
MTEDTVFDLASLTKVVATSTAVMQLIEAGRLRLDGPVARYWPAFKAHGKARITVRDLLTHYSGLPPDLDLEARWSGYGAALERIAAVMPLGSRGSLRLQRRELRRAGRARPARLRRALDVYCAKHIFDPLGMRDTSFRPAQRERVAPTAYAGGRLLSGVVHDPTARRMGVWQDTPASSRPRTTSRSSRR